MKIACLADLHITEKGTIGNKLFTSQGKNLKFLSLERCLNFAVERLIKEKPDIIFITEAFDRFNPTPNEIALFIETVIKLRENGSFIIVEPGNHGVDKNRLTASPYIFLKGQSNILYTDTPFHISYSDVDIFILPYPIKYVKSEFFESLNKFKNIAKENKIKGKKSILLGHFSVDVDFEDEVVVRSEILKDFDLCLLGHIHNHQKINNIYYIGSLDRLTFNEENDKKGFLLVNLENDTFNVNFIESPALILRTFYTEEVLSFQEQDLIELKKEMEKNGQFSIYRLVGVIKEETEREKIKYFIDYLKDFNFVINIHFHVERKIKSIVPKENKELSEEEIIINYVQNHNIFKTINIDELLNYHKKIKSKSLL